MKFKWRLNLSEENPPLPVRAYIHEIGLEDAYDNKKEGFVANAHHHLRQVLRAEYELFRGFNYILAAVWGDPSTKEKVIDCFGFSDVNPWPGNPEVSGWVMRNGVYSPQRELTCGDTIIVLGKEEAHRRTCKNLVDYLKNPPEMDIVEMRNGGNWA